MNLWSTFKSLRLSALWPLIGICLKNPLYVIPTIKATKRCILICDALYGQNHHKNTAANAFRHALWNFLISRDCSSSSKDQVKVLRWTKDITDWHEKFSKNNRVEMAMDLHNNRVGRILFLENQDLSEHDLVSLLKKMADSSIKIQTEEEVTSANHKTLVHLKDYKPNERAVL